MCAHTKNAQPTRCFKVMPPPPPPPLSVRITRTRRLGGKVTAIHVYATTFSDEQPTWLILLALESVEHLSIALTPKEASNMTLVCKTILTDNDFPPQRALFFGDNVLLLPYRHTGDTVLMKASAVPLRLLYFMTPAMGELVSDTPPEGNDVSIPRRLQLSIIMQAGPIPRGEVRRKQIKAAKRGGAVPMVEDTRVKFTAGPICTRCQAEDATLLLHTVNPVCDQCATDDEAVEDLVHKLTPVLDRVHEMSKGARV